MFGSTFKTGRATIPSQSQFLTNHYYIVINDLESNMDLDESLLEFHSGVKKRLDPRLGAIFKKYLASNNVWDPKFWRKDDPTDKSPTLSPADRLKKSERAIRQKLRPKSDTLLEKGYALGGLGRFEDAIMYFDNVFHSEKNLDALLWKACALGGLGKYEDGFKCLLQAESLREEARESGFASKEYKNSHIWQLETTMYQIKQLWNQDYSGVEVETPVKKGRVKDILETKLLARNVLRDIANNVSQTEKKNRTKQAIIDFVILNPESRNGDIWKHILANKETKVSLKMFNSYLAELVGEAQIKKTEEDKPGHKYPRYSLMLQPERWQYRLFLYDLWLKNISKGIDTLNRQAAKISPEVLTEQMYAINSALEDLLRKQKIMEKFSDHKLLPTGAGNKYIKNLKRLISVQTDALFGILDRVSAKKRKTVLDKMINLSEKDSLKSMSSMLNSGETPFIEFKSHLGNNSAYHPQYFSG